MGCGSGGCGNGAGNACSSGSCGQMSVHDWLENVAYPVGFDAVEVKFKGGRKAFYRNVNHLVFVTGDVIAVQADGGYHVGYVSAQGEIVRLQMKKYNVSYSEDLPIIYRIANEKDLEKWTLSKERELPIMFRTRNIVRDMGLEMKLSDIEVQADNTKATFFYSADDRVDFRELIKVLATEFKVRVEMRQISLRQEAGRLGGIGVCGRELCCSTWLTDFKSVQTSAARYQNLSLNPTKLSGQCGRLKCCLNYELDTYLAAIKEVPEVKFLHTEQGSFQLQKSDIFKKTMFFSVEGEDKWVEISMVRVHQIMALNEQGIKPYSVVDDEQILEEIDLALNSDLELLDQKYKSKKGGKNQPQQQKNNQRPQDKRRFEGSQSSTKVEHQKPQNTNPKQHPKREQVQKQNPVRQDVKPPVVKNDPKPEVREQRKEVQIDPIPELPTMNRPRPVRPRQSIHLSPDELEKETTKISKSFPPRENRSEQPAQQARNTENKKVENKPEVKPVPTNDNVPMPSESGVRERKKFRDRKGFDE